jgi:hypothetical protein
VTFSPAGPVPVGSNSGSVSVTARFAAPGTYRLLAIANDGQLSTRADATVTVK